MLPPLAGQVDIWLPAGRGIHLLFECGAPPLQSLPYTLRPYLPPSWLPWDTRQLGTLLQARPCLGPTPSFARLMHGQSQAL